RRAARWTVVVAPLKPYSDAVIPDGGKRRARNDGRRGGLPQPILQVPSFGGAMISRSSLGPGTVPSASEMSHWSFIRAGSLARTAYISIIIWLSYGRKYASRAFITSNLAPLRRCSASFCGSADLASFIDCATILSEL